MTVNDIGGGRPFITAIILAFDTIAVAGAVWFAWRMRHRP